MPKVVLIVLLGLAQSFHVLCIRNLHAQPAAADDAAQHSWVAVASNNDGKTITAGGSAGDDWSAPLWQST